MRIGVQSVLTGAARFYAPVILLFAATLLLQRAPGTGVGFFAGLAASLALILHALILGATATRDAFPPWLARLALGIGVALAVVATGAPRLEFAPRLAEAGAFLATVAASALIVVALAGRAPTMRGEAP